MAGEKSAYVLKKAPDEDKPKPPEDPKPEETKTMSYEGQNYRAGIW